MSGSLFKSGLGVLCTVTVAVTVWHLSMGTLDNAERAARVELNVPDRTLHIEIGADAYGFMCLTSLEYDQAYLPEEFLCLDCVRSEKTLEVLRKGWSKESIYLVYKTGNEMNVQEIDVSSLDSSSIFTSYQSLSDDGGGLGGRAQCTRSSSARASCASYAGSCLLLFEKTDG
jgi:hypothetical protein